MKKCGLFQIFFLSFFLLLTSEVSAQISIASSATGSATKKTLTVARPSGTVFADLLVAQISVVNASATVTSPTGWTLIRTDTATGLVQRLYYKAIDPASEAASYSWTFSANTNSVGLIVAVRGSDLLTPIIPDHSGAIGSGTAIVAPAVASTVANAGIVEFFSAVSTNSVTLPASATSTQTYKANTLSAGVGLEILAAGGDSGTRTANISPAASNVGQMIVLRPMSLSCFTDDFQDASIPDGSAPSNNWVVNQSPGALNPFLPKIVTNTYSRRLRMTDTNGNEATFASVQRTFPASGNLFSAEFNYYAYGGSGADGVVVTLSDAAVSPVAGAPGGSVGYAQDTIGTAGFAGGWLGVGFDEYGNFSSNDRGHCGPNPGQRANSIALRGKGSGSSGGNETCTNYPYLAGTAAGVINPTLGGTTPGIGRKYRVTVDSRVPGMAVTTVDVDTSGTGNSYTTALVGPLNILSTTQTLTPANFRVSFTSSTGGSTNVHEIDNLKICSLGMVDVRSIDHIRYYFDQAATACTAKPVTVRACRDNACTSWYTPTFTLDLTSTPVPAAGSPATGWTDSAGNSLVTATVVGGNNSTLKFRANGSPSPGTYKLGYANPSVLGGIPGLKLRCFSADGSSEWTAGNAPCNIIFTDQTGFTVSVPDLVAGINAVGGSATGTTVPATIKASSSSCGAGVVPAAFNNKSRSIKFWFNYLDPLAASVALLIPSNPPAVWIDPYEAAGNTTAGFNKLTTATPASGFNLYFDTTGTAKLDIAYPDVGRLQLMAQDALTSNTGAGQFTAKPDHFDFLAIKRTADGVANPGTAMDQTGATFIKAGNPFTVSLTAQAGSNGTTSPLFLSGICGASCYGQTTKLFGQETSPQGVFLTTSLVKPSGGNIPALTYNPSSTRTITIPGLEFGATGTVTTDALGVATVTDLAWNEVGILSLTARVAGNDYLGAGDVRIATTSANVGRFIPDHFTASLGGFASACNAGGFSYMSQPFATALVMVAEAQSSGGGATQNYTGVFVKGTASVQMENANNGVPIALSRLNATATPAWAAGRYTYTADQFLRTATPDGSFDDLDIGLKVTDSDKAPTFPYLMTRDMDAGNTACTIDKTGTSSAADVCSATKLVSATKVRYGRLRLLNFYGSELLPARVEYRAEYLNGKSWTTNTDDSCSALVAANVASPAVLGAPTAVSYRKGAGIITFPLAGVGSYDIAANLNFSGSNDSSCNPLPLLPLLPPVSTAGNMPWLQFGWCAGGDKDPNARIRLGSPKAPYIDLRERY